MDKSYRAAILLISAITLSGCVAKSNNKGYSYFHSNNNPNEFQVADNNTTQNDQSFNDDQTVEDITNNTPVVTTPKMEETTPIDSGDQTPEDTTGDETVTPPVEDETVTPPVADAAIASCPEETQADQIPAQIASFERLELHYTVLKGTPFTPAEDPSVEPGDGLPVSPVNYKLASVASNGDNAIELTDASAITPGQLLVYRNSGQGLTPIRAGAVNGNIVSLAGINQDTPEALFETIPAGQDVWNFYRDYTHPNQFGYEAIAEYAVNTLRARGRDLSGNHVFLGDSWFSDGTLVDRAGVLMNEATTTVNKGVGGHTLCNLLKRFDTDVTPNAPQYVWINSSVNDYYANVTQSEFYDRMKTLIGKVQSIGATAVVFDSAPGQEGAFANNTTDGADLRMRSQRYATQVFNLLAETQ